MRGDSSARSERLDRDGRIASLAQGEAEARAWVFAGAERADGPRRYGGRPQHERRTEVPPRAVPERVLQEPGLELVDRPVHSGTAARGNVAAAEVAVDVG